VIYLFLLGLVIFVNCLPAFAPPTWTLLVFFLTAYDLNLAAIVLCGVLGATIGRYILSHYSLWLSDKIFNKRKHENLNYLGNRISGTPIHTFLVVFLYSLTPLSTTALFVAVGVAKVSLKIAIPAFSLGRLISYSVLAVSTKAIAVNIGDLTNGIFTWESVVSSLAGLTVLLLFIFVDWQELFEHKKLKLNFQIWKWSK
jgi:membrane protein DedA with SNARE-associated domain